MDVLSPSLQPTCARPCGSRGERDPCAVPVSRHVRGSRCPRWARGCELSQPTIAGRVAPSDALPERGGSRQGPRTPGPLERERGWPLALRRAEASSSRQQPRQACTAHLTSARTSRRRVPPPHPSSSPITRPRSLSTLHLATGTTSTWAPWSPSRQHPRQSFRPPSSTTRPRRPPTTSPPPSTTRAQLSRRLRTASPSSARCSTTSRSLYRPTTSSRCVAHRSGKCWTMTTVR